MIGQPEEVMVTNCNIISRRHECVREMQLLAIDEPVNEFVVQDPEYLLTNDVITCHISPLQRRAAVSSSDDLLDEHWGKSVLLGLRLSV
jgi:hypothetical protein